MTSALALSSDHEVQLTYEDQTASVAQGHHVFDLADVTPNTQKLYQISSTVRLKSNKLNCLILLLLVYVRPIFPKITPE